MLSLSEWILEKTSIFLLASVAQFQTFCTGLVSGVWIICISGLCHDHPNSPMDYLRILFLRLLKCTYIAAIFGVLNLGSILR